MSLDYKTDGISRSAERTVIRSKTFKWPILFLMSENYWKITREGEKKKSTGHSNLLWKVWKGPLGKLKQDRQPDSAVRKPDLPPPKTEYRFIQHLPALRPTGLVNEH